MRLLFREDYSFTNDVNSEKHRLSLMWFVDNLDEFVSEFKMRNIEVAVDLKTRPYGLREFALIDINGYYVRIARLAEEDQKEAPDNI